MNYPNLERAFKHIGYDNGMINRYNTEDKVLFEMFKNVDKYNENVWKDVDTFFSRMNEEELEMFCCGGEENRDLTSSIARMADDFLNVAFDGE